MLPYCLNLDFFQKKKSYFTIFVNETVSNESKQLSTVSFLQKEQK